MVLHLFRSQLTIFIFHKQPLAEISGSFDQSYTPASIKKMMGWDSWLASSTTLVSKFNRIGRKDNMIGENLMSNQDFHRTAAISEINYLHQSFLDSLLLKSRRLSNII